MNVNVWEPRDAERELRQQLDGTCDLIQDYGRQSATVIKAAMLLAGYHQHHGAWRRRRHDRSDNNDTVG